MDTAFICLISTRPILLSPNVPAECFRESEETGLAVVYAEAAPYPVLVLASRDGLGRFYFFSVFAEPGFAVAPSAVMKRLLRAGHIRRIAPPSFEHRSL